MVSNLRACIEAMGGRLKHRRGVFRKAIVTITNFSDMDDGPQTM